MTTREMINWLLFACASACSVLGAYINGGWKAAVPAAGAAFAAASGIGGYVAGKTTTTPESLMTKLAAELKAADKKETAK